MIRIYVNTEYYVVVPGKAYSFRSPHAKDYKKLVKKMAKNVFDHPLSDNVEVRIDCFHTKPIRSDMDNIAKCILDALNGIAYTDDKQARLQKSTSHWLQEIICINGGPVDLIKPLADYDEYVFIRIRICS